MPYQYKREPLLPDEINRLANACKTADERIAIWTLLDTGLRVSEFTGLTRENIDWQGQRLIIHGKGGPYGTKTKRRVVPMTDRIRPLLEVKPVNSEMRKPVSSGVQMAMRSSAVLQGFAD